MSAPESSRRAEAVRYLARERWGRLVGSARAAGPDAEDAVQDVLERLAAGAGEPPADRERLTAYATVAVRRRALELVAGRCPVASERHAEPASTDDAADRVEARRLLAAYAQALGAVPIAARAAVVLDAAGWSRAQVAAACGVSERRVKRLLEEHRGPVLAAAARSLAGADCARLAATLEVYAAGRWQPRHGGPVAAHLALCAACRGAVGRTRAARAALRSLFPAPTGLAPPLSGVESAAIPLVAGALKAPWLVGLVVTVVVSAGTATVAPEPAGPRDPASPVRSGHPPAGGTGPDAGVVLRLPAPAAAPPRTPPVVGAAAAPPRRTSPAPTASQPAAAPTPPEGRARTGPIVPTPLQAPAAGTQAAPRGPASGASMTTTRPSPPIAPRAVPPALRGGGAPAAPGGDAGCAALGLC